MQGVVNDVRWQLPRALPSCHSSLCAGVDFNAEAKIWGQISVYSWDANLIVDVVGLWH